MKWGIDLGGTKIEGVLLDETTGKVVTRTRVHTEAAEGYAHILTQIEKLVRELETNSGSERQRIGIGTPGTMDPATGLLKNSNTLCLNGQPLDKDLERQLEVAVKIANDANCFALAEAMLGAVPEAVPGAKVVFGIIMGTGVGGGLVLDGQVWGGHHGIGGEWGHNVLEENGAPCYCGKRGCVEKVIAGPALESWYHQRTGHALLLREIANRWRDGEPDALALRDRLVDKFGLAITTLVNVIDPDAIVLGGGVANIDELYTLGIEAAEKYVFNKGVFTTPVLRPKLGDSAGVFGAAMLWK